ncbi:MAG: hypothetical protein WBJ03_11750 [Moraxellaceae bacterium]
MDEQLSGRLCSQEATDDSNTWRPEEHTLSCRLDNGMVGLEQKCGRGYLPHALNCFLCFSGVLQFFLLLRPFLLFLAIRHIFLVTYSSCCMAGNGHFLPGGKVSYGASRP